MARLLRSYGQSVIRKPAVVAPAVTFPPPLVRLAPSSTLGRRSHWRLSPPTVIAPAVTFAPVDVKLVQPPRSSRHYLYRISPPTVVGASITFRPVETILVKGPPPRLVRSKLSAPVVLGAIATPFMASPVLVKLTRIRPRPTVYEIRAPAVTGAAVVFAPVRVTRTFQPPAQSRRVSSDLRAPATLQQFVAFLATPILTRLARWRPPKPVQAELRPPAVVASARVFAPVKVRLARRPPQAGKSRSIVGKVIYGLALIVPTFWLEGDPAAATFDGDPAGTTLDGLRGSSTLEGDPGEGNMDGRSGSSGM